MEANPIVVQDCPLLDLPAELRTRIYEYALLSENDIAVDTTFKPPSLLQSCQQIRKEASKMYFAENNFVITCWNCDVKPWNFFMDAFEEYCMKKDGDGWRVTIGSINRRVPNWGNLFRSLKQSYVSKSRRILDLGGNATDSQMEKVIDAAQRIVCLAKADGRAWKDVEKELERFHYAIKALNAGWT